MPAFVLILGVLAFVATTYPASFCVCVGALVGWLAWSSLRTAKLRRLQRALYRDDVAAFRWRDDIDPVEFEQRCAEAMRFAGWKATLTKGSGDQGVDVVAERDGIRVVLQCKRYAKAVGNRAVQEAYAAKAFTGARYAAVVSNATYTPSARQLAAATGVLLLHFTDLARPGRHFGLVDRPSSHRPSQVTAGRIARLRERNDGVPFGFAVAMALAFAFASDSQKVATTAPKLFAGTLQPSAAVAATEGLGGSATHHPQHKGHKARREP